MLIADREAKLVRLAQLVKQKKAEAEKNCRPLCVVVVLQFNARKIYNTFCVSVITNAKKKTDFFSIFFCLSMIVRTQPC